MIPFGAVIKKLRVARGLTQAELAHRAGIRQAYLSQIEKGKKAGTIATLQDIGEVLRCPLPMMAWFAIEERDIPFEKRRMWRAVKNATQILLHELFPDIV